ncbi:hypothetical protein AUF12_05345 [Enterococcus avium]|uniref:hypothetical protein n=1 Tax=Enterococcus avium TaxID=33945 RepID=UPI000C9C9356|nr:hypothetical protein [Enterococcus avium]MDT2565146.1 hypothetical protein [Enterococcus avium]PNE49962.1 hypothetical protein AUF12_05345 [Enterococcus avium]
MDYEQSIDEVAAFWNLSCDEVASAIAGVKRSLKEIANALWDLAKQISENWETVQDREKEDHSISGTGQPMSLKEFLCIMNEAHRLAIEEDKKPPDRKAFKSYRK